MEEDLSPTLAAVGPRLRALRLRRAITLTDLAAQTGISVSTLSRLESGDRKPTLELLLPLARALRCHPRRTRRRAADRRSPGSPAPDDEAGHDDDRR